MSIRRLAAICKEDCNPLRVGVYVLLFASPIINGLIICLFHKQLIGLL
jgi:uncharacterized membrane protein YdjX (TVP38/TMEM64 family)